MNNMSQLLVSVQCLVFNHVFYLRECLNGFIMQKCDFKFEVIVHDDASTDNSAEIIQEYAEKYPDIIKPIYETENQYTQIGFGGIAKILYNQCKGKYIASCEGDDYWTDPYKLQKQVDYMEKHPECVYSCHRYMILIEATKEKKIFKNIYFDNNPNEDDFIFDVTYPFCKDWITKTLTSMYRKDAYDITKVDTFKFFRDVHSVYYLLNKGIGVCHSFVGGVYRKNSTSVFGSQSEWKQKIINYNVFKEFYKINRDEMIKEIAQSIYINLIIDRKKKPIPYDWFELETLMIYLPIKIVGKIKKYLVNKGA